MGGETHWRKKLLKKAGKDPRFFQRLIDNRRAPAGVLRDAGIELEAEEMQELERVLAADKPTVEFEWDAVKRASAGTEAYAPWREEYGLLSDGVWRE